MTTLATFDSSQIGWIALPQRQRVCYAFFIIPRFLLLCQLEIELASGRMEQTANRDMALLSFTLGMIYSTALGP
jgi:hypothetical protein